MKTNELREAFLSFFESKGCRRRPSDALVPKGDPSVLFTPAGMNQFKREFLGLGDPEFKRAVTCQKCLRTGDIENVGKTAYHHTFFEMLGNFSFGDYFKLDAIDWAWEFCTSPQWLNLPADRLSVSVYQDDHEAARIWEEVVGVPAARIARMGEDDNFWPAGAPSHGPDGVCGPCSEIFFHPAQGPEVEIWNLVFTQFNRTGPPPDNLAPLPAKNIDTGMGLERTAAVLQGVSSNFDIDIFRPLLEAIAEVLQRKYQPSQESGVRMRRIADHIRAVTFCVHENVFPSNKKQGYVVRRLLRRAVLDGYRLGQREPFFHKLPAAVCQTMRDFYPELDKTLSSVSNVVRQEEEQFFATLETGVSYLDQIFEKLHQTGASVVHGEDAFRLHDTYGFPIELIDSLAAERGFAVDHSRIGELREEHRQISGAGAFSDKVFATGPLDELSKSVPGTDFLGYKLTRSPAHLRGIIAVDRLLERCAASEHATLVLVLDQTPFYAESGGQVGDTGVISGPELRFEVKDTQKEGNFILHIGAITQGQVQLEQEVTAEVDPARRAAIMRAHSTTHLLHYALHQTLGDHATQAGSKVDDDYLRFDFAHPAAVSAEELEHIEDIINGCIRQAAPVEWRIMPIEDARKLGAMALFGEKYGDEVRVVTMGDFSTELCGGTHLSNTGQAGLCRIISEESVSAGTRRIVALTGPAAVAHARKQEHTLRDLSRLLKASPQDLTHRAAALLDEVRAMKKQLAERQQQSAGASAESLLQSALDVAGVKLITGEVPDCSADDMRRQIDLLRAKASPAAILLGSRSDGKVQLVASLSKELVERGLSAATWVKDAAKLVAGGGGGRPDLAQAGGKKPDELPKAIAHANQVMRALLSEA